MKAKVYGFFDQRLKSSLTVLKHFFINGTFRDNILLGLVCCKSISIQYQLRIQSLSAKYNFNATNFISETNTVSKLLNFQV